MTDTLKQSIRYQKADYRWRKPTYASLNADQKKMVKLVERLEVLNTDLNYFWSHAPRMDSGAVDWDAINEKELDQFEYLNKEIEKSTAKIARLEEKGISEEGTMRFFREVNMKSVCFGN
jgi:hypothetical protein